jgi:hypothetical protein
MPSFTYDISDEIANLVDSAIKEGGPGDFNEGQRTAWSNVKCDVSGKVTVRIAGRDVDVTADVSIKCDGAEYISEAVKNLESMGEMIGKSIEAGNYFLRDELVERAYDDLG